MVDSPSVEVFERDLTLNINNVTSNATGYVGMFRWGPVEEVIRITTNESELVRRLGRPDNQTSIFFHSALNYLLYTNPLFVVRIVGDNAVNAVPETETPLMIKNEAEYETVNLDGISFVARYPGQLGNSLRVVAADSSNYDTWEYSDQFTYTPEGDEFNLLVIDEDGLVTGQAGQVLERYELMTTTPGAKKPDGSSAYITKAIQDQSSYILVGDVSAIDFTASDSLGIYDTSLQGGVDDNDPQGTNVDFAAGWQIFSNAETLNIIRGFTSGNPTTGVTGAIDVMVGRQDAVAFAAPKIADVYNVIDAETNVKEYFTVDINKNTSYAFYVDNWKLVYDKYNDKNIWIPTDSDAAALHARVFVQNEPWFSPAGLNRGQIKNVIKLAWNPNKAQRDILYQANVNSIVSIPGEGTVLWGDKTALRRPSAFAYINVRTLFIVIKKNISQAARYQLFELNDPITRSVFRNATDSYLNRVQGRRGIYEYRVVCDETNNTGEVIDAGEFIGDMYVKPARSIQRIRLNFIAVGASVEFSEIEGV